jgi:hypothetical protein
MRSFLPCKAPSWGIFTIPLGRQRNQLPSAIWQHFGERLWYLPLSWLPQWPVGSKVSDSGRLTWQPQTNSYQSLRKVSDNRPITLAWDTFMPGALKPQGARPAQAHQPLRAENAICVFCEAVCNFGALFLETRLDTRSAVTQVTNAVLILLHASPRGAAKINSTQRRTRSKV